jgi:flagellar protein FliS
MTASPGENYLTTETLTAPPQKLQLLLIEAAIRAARRAGRQWQAGRPEQALPALLHAQAVVAELLRGVNQQLNSALTDRVAAVYAFVFRRLAEAGYSRDEEKLADAVRLLEIERQTWQQVCQQTVTPQRVDAADEIPPPAGRATQAPVESPEPSPSGGLSLEA